MKEMNKYGAALLSEVRPPVRLSIELKRWKSWQKKVPKWWWIRENRLPMLAATFPERSILRIWKLLRNGWGGYRL
ncbi:hypothetical protein J2S78_001705 [Salibacterium salarium]|nr:hypothetical protein [Salibacterium salarium]